MAWLMWYVTLVAISGTTMLIPCLQVKSLHLIWRLGTHAQSSNELQWLDYMIGYHDDNHSNGCQEICPTFTHNSIKQGNCKIQTYEVEEVFPWGGISVILFMRQFHTLVFHRMKSSSDQTLGTSIYFMVHKFNKNYKPLWCSDACK